MSRKSDNIISALSELQNKLGRELHILETGTIRNVAPEYSEGDGHSTIAIAEYVRDNGGEFISVDLSVAVAEKYLREKRLLDYVTLFQSNSLPLLDVIDGIDFYYLDSANDAETTFAEYLYAAKNITKGGYIMVDDCNLESTELKKGDRLMPYLDERGIAYEKQPETNQILIRL